MNDPIFGHDLCTMNQVLPAIDDSDNVDDIYNNFAIGATHIFDANRSISGNNIVV